MSHACYTQGKNGMDISKEVVIAAYAEEAKLTI